VSSHALRSIVGEGVGVGEAVGVGVGSDGLKTGFRDGFGAALIVTPLFQTSFFPDLTHVNFLLAAVAVAPALVHFVPALGVAAWSGVARASIKVIAINSRPLRRIGKG
jgi:hypothetical protein